MAPVKLREVIVFSSQDPIHKVENLLHQSSQWKRWLCSSGDRSGSIQALFQLEKAAKIGYVDLGNYGSAFVEILVQKSSWSSNRFVTLIPATILMSPMECKSGQNKCGVKMFTKANLTEESLADEWDRIKVVCSQPYKKDSQFGLAFIRLRSLEDKKDQDQTVSPGPTMTKLHHKSGNTPTMNNKSPRGRMVLSPSWKTNSSFQRQVMTATNSEKYSDGETAELKNRLLKMASTADSGSDKSNSLSRSAQMVLASSNSQVTPRRSENPSRGTMSSDTAKSPGTGRENSWKIPANQRRRDSDAENQRKNSPPPSNHLGNRAHGNKNSRHKISPESKGQPNNIRQRVLGEGRAEVKKGHTEREKLAGPKLPTKRTSNSTTATSPTKMRCKEFEEVAEEFLRSHGRVLLDSKLSDIRPGLQNLLGRKLSKQEKKVFKELAVARVDYLVNNGSPPEVPKAVKKGQNLQPKPNTKPKTKPKTKTNSTPSPHSSSSTLLDLTPMEFRDCPKCFLKFTARQITGHILDCQGIQSASSITKAQNSFTDSPPSPISSVKTSRGRGGRGRGRGRGRRGGRQASESLPLADPPTMSTHIPTAVMPSYQGAVPSRKPSKKQLSPNSSPPNPGKTPANVQIMSTPSPPGGYITANQSSKGTVVIDSDDEEDCLPCPVCNVRFPLRIIETHANLCLQRNTILEEMSKNNWMESSDATLLY
ncbi:DNA repair protein XRCC1-like [Asterias rubens]|uniref:DNA repair protein XRCC1-like n=1 Tax=Asterias rubens TaxID=7604 RepID=UPI0014552913|nr:DNA repair protein XRCC1-like [Asterias rubens]